MEDEYRAVNADLAAALITVGARLRGMETGDGVTIEFVFEPTLMDDGIETPVSAMVQDWSAGMLRVDALTLSKNLKRVYKSMRDKKREFQNSQ